MTERRDYTFKHPNGGTRTTHNRLGDWAVTASGRVFFPMDPAVEDIHVPDIIYSLARICRFNGHIRPEWLADIYSVGQHSLYCLREARRRGLSRQAQKLVLLHDAHEGFCQDIIRGLKRGLPEYQALEEAWALMIRLRFALPEMPDPAFEELADIDNRILLDEKRHVINPNSPAWGMESCYAPLGIQIEPMSAREVMQALSDEFYHLGVM